jgi:hypothetical protein
MNRPGFETSGAAKYEPADFPTGEVVGRVEPPPGGFGLRTSIRLEGDQTRQLDAVSQWKGMDPVATAQELFDHALAEAASAPLPALSAADAEG